jgi:hypothetical protein
MNKDMIIPAAAGYFALRLANGEIRRRPIIAWALPAGELIAFPICAGEAPEPTYQGIECPDGYVFEPHGPGRTHANRKEWRAAHQEAA